MERQRVHGRLLCNEDSSKLDSTRLTANYSRNQEADWPGGIWDSADENFKR